MAPHFGGPWVLTLCPSPLPAIFNKDLLATLHLLVALAKRFQPDLPLPSNVQVEMVTTEVRGWAPRGAWAWAEHLGSCTGGAVRVRS